MFETTLNPILGPLLNIAPLWAIIIISLVIAAVITFVYKWMTDQHLMKTLKEDIKKFQQEMKEFKQDPKKVMEIQKRAMETNMKYMMHSMKPTLITFIPIIIIFGWLNANLAYEPILPDTEFTTTAMFAQGTTGNVVLEVPEQIEILNNEIQEIKDDKAVWQLKGEQGEYILDYTYEDQTYQKELLITNEQAYKQPIKRIKDSNLKIIQIDNDKLRPLFGLSWIWTYIIFSIIFSMSLRKILKLH